MHQFYADVGKSLVVYTIRDERGFPAPKNGQGVRSMPFWSTQARAEKIVNKVPAYANFRVVMIELNEFLDYWLVDLEKAGQLVGVNWSGSRAMGYDLEPNDVRKTLMTVMDDMA